MALNTRNVVLALVVLAVIVVFWVLVWMWWYPSGSFKYRRFQGPNSNNAFRGGIRTDVAGDKPYLDRPYQVGPDTEEPSKLRELLASNSTYPIINVGNTPCAVSPSNNCPSHLAYTCPNNTDWSDAAKGELLALAATGAYAVPSIENERKMSSLMNFSYDTVNEACANADVAGQYMRNIQNVGAGNVASFASPAHRFGA